MTTIYSAVAQSILPVLPMFTLLSTTTPTLYREATPATPSQDAVVASDGTRTLYVIPAKSPFLAQAMPGTQVYTCDYFIMGALSQSLEAEQVITDGTRAFYTTGAPNRDFGLILAPAAVYTGTL
jgi:hypothetical protein